MSNILLDKTTPEERFVALHERRGDFLFNGESTYLASVRSEAVERFSALGFPGRKDEAWKYTNLKKILRVDYVDGLTAISSPLTRADLSPYFIEGLDAFEVVLVNGRFSEALSSIDDLPPETIIKSLTDAGKDHTELIQTYFARYADHNEDVFIALNTAFAAGGVFIYIPENVILEKPVYVLSVQDGKEDVFIQPRNLLVFQGNSQATVIERSVSIASAKTFSNVVDEVIVSRNAQVVYCKIQDEGERASLITNTHVHQESDSNFSIYTLTLTGQTVRNNLHILPDAENCETSLYGLFIPRGNSHVDNQTLVDHAKPLCMSRQLYKGILDGRATGVFNGKVFVRQDAQKISAFQEQKTVILSEGATMNAKPELEIYADDVKCSHGSTTGQIDSEALFYLRSRGISETRARALLLQAFARDVIDEIPIDPVKQMMEKKLSNTY